MSRSLRRGALAATALVVSVASLTACGAGNDAQTLQIRPDNAATKVGDIKVQNAVVITQPEGEGQAAVAATVFNDGSKPQTLEGVQLPGSDAKAALKPAEGSGPVTIPAGGSVVFGGKGNAAIVVEGLEPSVQGGVQDVVFQLSETGDVKLQALVHPSGGYLEDFGPTGAPSAPAASASPAGSPAPSGSPAASASPSGSPAGSPAASAPASPAQGEGGESH
ncbi:DUF461 domain-containing protein [Streptomyces fradiae]|uniref:DUF461 domain-containing protein n=1 Tax=Streptomyces fradiae TaxID=1906 RepID=UPI0035BE8743